MKTSSRTEVPTVNRIENAHASEWGEEFSYLHPVLWWRYFSILYEGIIRGESGLRPLLSWDQNGLKLLLRRRRRRRVLLQSTHPLMEQHCFVAPSSLVWISNRTHRRYVSIYTFKRQQQHRQQGAICDARRLECHSLDGDMSATRRRRAAPVGPANIHRRSQPVSSRVKTWSVSGVIMALPFSRNRIDGRSFTDRSPWI